MLWPHDAEKDPLWLARRPANFRVSDVPRIWVAIAWIQPSTASFDERLTAPLSMAGGGGGTKGVLQRFRRPARSGEGLARHHAQPECVVEFAVPAMSTARLWRDQGKRQRAHDLLAPVYGWFTEGGRERKSQ
jgi:hypothetical protein